MGHSSREWSMLETAYLTLARLHGAHLAPVVIGHSFGGLILQKYLSCMKDESEGSSGLPRVAGTGFVCCVPPRLFQLLKVFSFPRLEESRPCEGLVEDLWALRAYEVRQKKQFANFCVFACVNALALSFFPSSILLLWTLRCPETPPSAHPPLPAHAPCPWLGAAACSLVPEPLPLPLPPLPRLGAVAV
eukprot:1154027-Pelagomonas_calceolata.AAC.1